MKTSFVLDSSVALAWCFPEEATAETQELLDRMAAESAAVPAWWFIELTNVLYLAEKKKRPRQIVASIQISMTGRPTTISLPMLEST